MPKRTDIKKVLVIGSGPIVIGQAAEFDYAGTQACLALKEEGYEVILANSNPATIMTDTTIADKVYMEPLTLEYVAKIIRYERPDAIVPGIAWIPPSPPVRRFAMTRRPRPPSSSAPVPAASGASSGMRTAAPSWPGWSWPRAGAWPASASGPRTGCTAPACTCCKAAAPGRSFAKRN